MRGEGDTRSGIWQDGGADPPSSPEVPRARARRSLPDARRRRNPPPGVDPRPTGRPGLVGLRDGAGGQRLPGGAGNRPGAAGRSGRRRCPEPTAARMALRRGRQGGPLSGRGRRGGVLRPAAGLGPALVAGRGPALGAGCHGPGRSAGGARGLGPLPGQRHPGGVACDRGQPPWRLAGPILDVLAALAPGVPATTSVLVMADRGLWSPRLWDAIRGYGWHPMMRIRPEATFRPCGGQRGRAAHLLPGPGHAWVGAGIAYKDALKRKAATLVAVWEVGQDEPCLVLTDLPPEAVGPCWYGL